MRGLSRPAGLRDYDVYDSKIAAGRDGSVWVFSADGFFRLGDEAEHVWGGAKFLRDAAPSVGADGRPWLLEGRVLRSYDGERWKVERRQANGFDMWPDGTMWTRDLSGHLLRSDDADWIDVIDEIRAKDPGSAWRGQLWVSPRIDEDLAADLQVSDPAVEVLYTGTRNHNGVSVQFFAPGVGDSSGPAGAVEADLRHVDMADAGDWWIYQTLDIPRAGSGRTQETHYLVHVDDLSRRVLTDAEGVPETAHSDTSGLMEAGPGGRVWMSVGTWAGNQIDCGGAASFDGQTWRHVLGGVCVYDLDVAPDGSVWIQGATGGYMADAVDTYVIRPENAMADR